MNFDTQVKLVLEAMSRRAFLSNLAKGAAGIAAGASIINLKQLLSITANTPLTHILVELGSDNLITSSASLLPKVAVYYFDDPVNQLYKNIYLCGVTINEQNQLNWHLALTVPQSSTSSFSIGSSIFKNNMDILYKGAFRDAVTTENTLLGLLENSSIENKEMYELLKNIKDKYREYTGLSMPKKAEEYINISIESTLEGIENDKWSDAYNKKLKQTQKAIHNPKSDHWIRDKYPARFSDDYNERDSRDVRGVSESFNSRVEVVLEALKHSDFSKEEKDVFNSIIWKAFARVSNEIPLPIDWWGETLKFEKIDNSQISRLKSYIECSLRNSHPADIQQKNDFITILKSLKEYEAAQKVNSKHLSNVSKLIDI